MQSDPDFGLGSLYVKLAATLMIMNRKPIFQYATTLLLSLLTTISFGQKIFSIQTDPRVEALSIFYTLATANTLDTKPTPSTYYKDVKTYFKSYNQHQSLNWYRNLKNWDGPDMASLGLFLSQKHPFKLEIKPEINYIRNASLDTFISYFNAFYKDCQVETFLTNHKNAYNKINKKGELHIEKSGILAEVVSFYQSNQSGEFVIYTDFLCNHGSNAITSKDQKFAGKIIAKAGYIEDKSKKLTDDSLVNFEPAPNVVAHECSHIYLKNFLSNYHDRLFKIRSYFLTTTAGKKLDEAYWENEVDELLVRACVAKILSQKYGEESGDAEIANQSKHFKGAKELYSFFDAYSNHRDRYRSIEDFYPEMIGFLESMATNNDIIH
ncbi:DUF4932 domain-containing protein [Pedobacter sp. BMA]|uniref:DUF4932 domain-containing protein n=1 Tax=Pedobacter sp. BMA TaxID=1663685 RepID=UPI00064A9C97|nr:DUF4932 domain-containing protein [Pedobacter sp. BMA]KLT63742.1 hypothetical protein AB669_20030 [Pedobacter sp. BMA]